MISYLSIPYLFKYPDSYKMVSNMELELPDKTLVKILHIEFVGSRLVKFHTLNETTQKYQIFQDVLDEAATERLFPSDPDINLIDFFHSDRIWLLKEQKYWW